jgi:hypothetical protein
MFELHSHRISKVILFEAETEEANVIIFPGMTRILSLSVKILVLSGLPQGGTGNKAKIFNLA